MALAIALSDEGCTEDALICAEVELLSSLSSHDRTRKQSFRDTVSPMIAAGKKLLFLLEKLLVQSIRFVTMSLTTPLAVFRCRIGFSPCAAARRRPAPSSYRELKRAPPSSGSWLPLITSSTRRESASPPPPPPPRLLAPAAGAEQTLRGKRSLGEGSSREASSRRRGLQRTYNAADTLRNASRRGGTWRNSRTFFFIRCLETCVEAPLSTLERCKP